MDTQITNCAGGVVVNDQGDVIVVEQKNMTWSLPKGHVEKDEDFLTTAKREIEEESGVTELVLIKEFPPYERVVVNKNERHPADEIKRLHFFLFRTHQKDLRPKDPDNPQAQWVKKTDVAAKLTHRKDQEFFKSILNEI
jgi:ADP-ribose pyrophosphatase YjhB (NUDIX family)